MRLSTNSTQARRSEPPRSSRLQSQTGPRSTQKGITGRRLRLYNAQEHWMSLELTLNVSKRTFAHLKGRGTAPTDILHDAAMRCPFANDVPDVRCADHCASRSCSGIQPRAARTNSSVTGKTKTRGFTRRSSSCVHIQTTPQTRLPNESTHNWTHTHDDGERNKTVESLFRAGNQHPQRTTNPPLPIRIDNTPQANTKPQHSILSVPTKPIHLQHTPRPTTVTKQPKREVRRTPGRSQEQNPHNPHSITRSAKHTQRGTSSGALTSKPPTPPTTIDHLTTQRYHRSDSPRTQNMNPSTNETQPS